MKDNVWQLQDAKSKFSQLVNDAMVCEPQFVTKYGEKAVVVLSMEEYERITKPKGDLLSFFRDSPLVGEELEVSREKDLPRDNEF